MCFCVGMSVYPDDEGRLSDAVSTFLRCVVMPGLFILEREDLTVLAVCINSNRQFWARESEATDSAQI